MGVLNRMLNDAFLRFRLCFFSFHISGSFHFSDWALFTFHFSDWALGGAALGLTVALVEFIANSVVEVPYDVEILITMRMITIHNNDYQDDDDDDEVETERLKQDRTN